MIHIRKSVPRRHGNSFYRDKTDYSRYAATLCGAAITDKDIDIRTSITKKFRRSEWFRETCAECFSKLRYEAVGYRAIAKAEAGAL